MKLKVLLFCVLLSMVTMAGCDDHFDGSVQRPSDSKGMDSSSRKSSHSPDDVDDLPEIGRAVVVSALEYPEGYDWRRDTLYGEVDCRLVLAAVTDYAASAGQLVHLVERTVGYASRVSSDMDMHRIAGGRLYDCYSSSDTTTICCNGKEVCRWKGNESVMDIVLKESGLYALCIPRDGPGYVLRRDGEALVSGREGIPASSLYEDGNKLYFNVLDVSNEGGKQNRKWYVAGEEGVDPVSAPVSSATVYHVLRVGGKVCQAYVYKRACYLAVGSDRKSISSNGVSEILPIALKNVGNQVFVETSVKFADGSEGYMLWKGTSLVGVSRGGFTRYASCSDGQDLWCMGRLPDSGAYVILHGSGMIPLPEGFVPVCPRAMSFVGGKLYVSLCKDGLPYLWIDGKLVGFGFNGYIDQISMIE